MRSSRFACRFATISGCVLQTAKCSVVPTGGWLAPFAIDPRCEVVGNAVDWLATGSMLPEFCSTETCILPDKLGKSSVATVASSNNRCSVGRVVSWPICLYHALHRSATLCCVHAYAYNAQWVHVADRESGNTQQAYKLLIGVFAAEHLRSALHRIA
jgi:hypothetical protein